MLFKRANQEERFFFVFASPESLAVYCVQRLLICVYFEIKMLNNGSFPKAKKTLEQMIKEA